MKTYQRVILTHRGGPSSIRIIEEPLRDPAPGEVRIRVLAAGVAYADLMMSRGLYPGAPRFPFTPGYDIVGEIDARGDGVRSVDVGQNVAALTVFGGYTQFIYLRAEQVLSLPAGLDPAQTVCLVLNYVTAYQMLHRQAFVKKSESLLIYGAAGGVGTAVLQLGHLAGLRIIGAASASKHELITRLGAVPIDYHNNDIPQAVRQIEPQGLDVILESMSIEQAYNSLKLLKPDGRLIIYGMKNALQEKKFGIGQMIRTGWQIAKTRIRAGKRSIRMYSINSSKKKHPDWFKDDLYSLINLLQEKKIDPLIAERFALADAEKAHLLLLKGQTLGKIVLLPNGAPDSVASHPLPKF